MKNITYIIYCITLYVLYHQNASDPVPLNEITINVKENQEGNHKDYNDYPENQETPQMDYSQTEAQTPIAWCFGYGSLVDSYADKGKYVEVCIKFRRVWNAWNTKARATFLGLEPYEKKTSITGLIYPIFSEQELADLDLREQGYKKEVIPHENVRVMNAGLNKKMQKMELDGSMQLFTYVPESGGNSPNAMFPILQSYIDLLASGFLKFRQQNQARDETDPVRRFLDTTYGWSEYMLNDRVLARRPWKFEGNHFVIDDYLDDEDDVHDIPAALYPEDYAVKYFEELKQGLLVTGQDRVKYVANE